MRIAPLLAMCALLSLPCLAAPSQSWLGEVGFTQRIGARLAGNVVFADEAGNPVRLHDLTGTRPALLVLGYYACRNLCGIFLGELAARLRDLDLRAGRDFEVVAVSIDPDETPALARARKAQYHGGATSWHFLTGSPEAIAALAQAVGFRYRREPTIDAFVHPAGAVILTPDGHIARYLFALDPDNKALRYGIIEASGNRLGTPADRLWLLCHTFDPASGRYTSLVIDIERGLGLVSAAAFAGFLGWLGHRGRGSR